MNRASVHEDLMKVYIIQSKNGIMVSVGVTVKNQTFNFVVMMIIFGILVRIIVSVKFMPYKIDE